MELRIFQKGFNYSQDGPGNRLVYHLQGCPLHCPWCSNPEGKDLLGQGSVQTCGELLREAVSCRPMMLGGGGVTLTGGEVLMQAEAAGAFLQMLQEAGIHTAVESCLSMPGFERILPHLDCLLCDCKHPDEERLFAVTGGRFPLVLANIRLALDTGIPVAIRIPLVHGFNDDDETQVKFTHLFAALQGSFTVELLLYHEYGRDKWARLGLPYTVQDGFVPDGVREAFEARLRNAGIRVVRT